MAIEPAVLVHGGAGDMDPRREADAVAGCAAAADAGHRVLAGGGSALDAACAAVAVLESNPMFNAGVGSVLNRDGEVEVDAAVMEGTDLRVGAIAAVARAGAGIAMARTVLEDGEHVLLAGEGAWRFLREHGFEPAPLESLISERSMRRLERERERREEGRRGEPDPGTVGAVAVDSGGHVAAATSTGGTTYKRAGRVGDTPLIGCGTYADDHAGAASATGHGEAIIRVTMARVAIDAMSSEDARAGAWRAVDALDRVAGRAGIICAGADGSIGVAHNTKTMPVAWVRGGGAAIERGAFARVAGTDLERR